MLISQMPPLYHRLPGEEYQQDKSQVLAWTMQQLLLAEYIYDQAANAKEIVYDPETGMWQGADYED